MNIKLQTAKIMSVLLTLLFITIIVIFITSVYQKNVLKQRFSNIFGFTIFNIKTGSMMPSLEVGDIVLVKITKDVAEGNIVIYKDENNDCICHRVIGYENDTFILKGDANNTNDEPVKSSKIIGKVIKKFSIFKLFQKI